jgi:hypothetical protein
MPTSSVARVMLSSSRRSKTAAAVAQSHSIFFPYESTRVHVLDAQRALA